jgi:cell division protein FtsN
MMKSIQTQRGSTTLGIIVGVVLGLAVALGVSLYLANASAPLQTKAVNPTARIEAPKDLSKAPDPNEALYTKLPKAEESSLPATDDSSPAKTLPPPTMPPPPTKAAVAAASASNKPEQDAIGKIAAIVTPNLTPVKPTEPAAPPKPSIAVAGGERYFVQAGAFSQINEAEALKAKLALVGVTMTLSPRDKDGQVLQRVRTAPLAAVDAEKLRNQLKANGIETSLVKVQ